MQINQATLINGSFNGVISALDRGLAYGDGVFRTLKIINGIPVHWPLHYQKLVEDCSAIGIVCPSADLFMSDFSQLFVPDEPVSVAKIIMTRGEGERGYKPSPVASPLRVVTKSKLPDYPESNFTEGVLLHVCDTRIGYQPKLAGVKHLNRLENVLARMEWSAPEVADGIMLDTEGNVIECTSANVFARFDDLLVTPKLDLCGVAGITRMQILSHAHTLDLKTQIERIDLKTLLSADEVVLSNSIYGAWQVRSLANKTWGKQLLATKIREAISV
ncbi:MAG: aminodeoxychorismate lyase [Methylophilaceae bacterium]